MIHDMSSKHDSKGVPDVGASTGWRLPVLRQSQMQVETVAIAEVTDIAPLLFQPFPLAGRPMQRHSGFRVPVIKDS